MLGSWEGREEERIPVRSKAQTDYSKWLDYSIKNTHSYPTPPARNTAAHQRHNSPRGELCMSLRARQNQTKLVKEFGRHKSSPRQGTTTTTTTREGRSTYTGTRKACPASPPPLPPQPWASCPSCGLVLAHSESESRKKQVSGCYRHRAECYIFYTTSCPPQRVRRHLW